jgi:hypothetical protein
MNFNVFRKRQSDNQLNSNDDSSNIKEEILRNYCAKFVKAITSLLPSPQHLPS